MRIRNLKIRNLPCLSEIPPREEAGEEVVGGAVDTLHLRVSVLVKKSTRVCVCVFVCGMCVCVPARECMACLTRDCCAPRQLSSLSSPEVGLVQLTTTSVARLGSCLRVHLRSTATRKRLCHGGVEAEECFIRIKHSEVAAPQ